MNIFKKDKYRGLIRHFTSAALIKKGNRYLMIDRRKKPFGWAVVAGHVDRGENFKQALEREVKEESNLNIKKAKLIFKETVRFGCRRIGSYHCVSLYDCDVFGKIKVQKDEVKRYGWFTIEEMKRIKIEPLWKYLFKRLKILV